MLRGMRIYIDTVIKIVNETIYSIAIGGIVNIMNLMRWNWEQSVRTPGVRK
jgi:hypothetical protein